MRVKYQMVYDTECLLHRHFFLLPVGSEDLSADKISLRKLRGPTHQQLAPDGRGAPAPKPCRRAPAQPADSTGPGPDSHGLPGGCGDALHSGRVDSGLGSLMLGFPSEPGPFPLLAGGWGWSGGLLGGTETISIDGHRRQRTQQAQGPRTPKPRANSLSVPPLAGRGSTTARGTHSSILTWEIPWTEKPGGLQSMVSQKSGT